MGFGFRVWSLEIQRLCLGVRELGFGVQHFGVHGFGVQGLGFKLLGFRVSALGFRV